MADLESVVTDLRRDLDRPELRVIGHCPSGSDLVVATVGAYPSRPELVVKIARTVLASGSLLREADALSALHADPRVRDLARSVPSLIASGMVGDHTFVTQGHVGGADGRTADLCDRDHSESLLGAARAIAGLHRATRIPTTLTDDHVARLVDLRLEAALRDGRLQVARRLMPALDRLGGELRGAMVGRPAHVGWIHGDYWLGNVVVDGAGQLRGIIDWDEMQFASLPGIDMVHLILTTRAIHLNREFGSIVLAALDDASLSDAEAAVMARLTTADGVDGVPWRALVLLVWLHHVTSRARRWSGRSGRWLWKARNVDQVLETL